MHVLSIVGARPQIVKLAPISWSAKGQIDHQILHTGQHYDPLLSESFFNELDIPKPNFQLETGSGTHGDQTGRMLMQIENVLLENKPDHVIVYGDTNSTLAGALAASKLNIPVSHVEAGLRSFNRQMPEEINRVLTDHCSELLFAPTFTGYSNLSREGLEVKSFLSGDVMVETLDFIRRKGPIQQPSESYIFATIHRAENTDDFERISFLISKLKNSKVKVHLHCHPRLKKVLEKLSLYMDSANLIFLPPLDYFSTINKVLGSIGVITDSGGLQKESYILNKPCMVVRNESEWVETLADGRNFLDPELNRVSDSWWDVGKTEPDLKLFGDGNASKKILEEISRHISFNT
jgi:UDP-N-acetylglucosamine 2-epimerase (non-hydrolysing)